MGTKIEPYSRGDRGAAIPNALIDRFLAAKLPGRAARVFWFVAFHTFEIEGPKKVDLSPETVAAGTGLPRAYVSQALKRLKAKNLIQARA